MKNLGEIRVSDRGPGLVIEIEGMIGVPEWWQFDTEDERVATYEKFRDSVGRIAQAGARRVRVNIRSLGGEVNDALLIYEALCGLGAEVTTCCYGYVASAATIIAQAASPGRRLISPHSLYLIHNAVTSLEGNSQDATRAAGVLSKTDERIAQLYASRSGRSPELFRELMARDGGHGEWLSPEEVLEYGLADEIHRPSPIESVRRSVRNFFGRSGRAVTEAMLGYLEGPDTADEKTLPEPETPVPPREAGRPAGTALLPEMSANVSVATEVRHIAGPSVTLPKEDPAAECHIALPGQSANRQAYDGDLSCFRPGY